MATGTRPVRGASVAADLRVIWIRLDWAAADAALHVFVARHRSTAYAFAWWLVANISDAFGVLSQSAAYRVCLRATNMLERGVQQEVKRRPRTIRPFPDTDAVTRLVTAILMDIDENGRPNGNFISNGRPK